MPKNLNQLPRIKESISFIYLEKCHIEQDNMAIAKVLNDGSRTPIPIANITCLLIGPGTTITHAAIKAISDCGCSVVWCGENGFRFYAYGRGETRSGKNLLIQARLCMDEKLHMKVVRKMYSIRFGDVSTNEMNLNQLRGIEGVRVKKAYANASKISGIPWKTRDLGIGKEWDTLKPLDQALIYSNKILYAVCSSVIVSLGLSTGLGFIHTGRSESFSYDIADLYKAETTIPASFEAVRIYNNNKGDLEFIVRQECRKAFHKNKLMKRIPKDIAELLNCVDDEDIESLNPASDLWGTNGNAIKTGSWNLSKLISERDNDGSDGNAEC